jgi:tetratricopeptide (TPR) repeat protein
MKARSPASSPSAASEAFLTPRRLALLLFGLTFLAYFPALQAGFIWDDQPGHVTRPELQSLGGLIRIWIEPGATQQYYPLLHSTFWLEHQLWGDAPFGYHLVNLLLHATAVCLFAALLRRLAVPGAALAAVLFAVHPICVETVAWVSEQKNTLSLVLYLCAALAYVRFDSTRRPAAYALAAAVFIAALLTKTVTASLPAALLVVFWWQRGRLALRRDVFPLLPWFACSLLAALVTARVEHDLIGAHGTDFALSFVQRLLLAAQAPWFYVGKLLFPFDLSFIYPRRLPDPSDAVPWLALLATVALFGALLWWSRRSRAPLTATLLFTGGLFPALGFINVFPFLYSFVADHFQYLPCLALFALAAAGLTRLAPTVRLATTAALVLLFGALTFQQSRTYHDVITLYEATLTRNPSAWMAHNNLGLALVEAGRAEEALPHFAAALKLRPAYAEAENNFGDALNQLGRTLEAIPHLERSLTLQPNYPEAHNNLAVALLSNRRTAESIAHLTEALRLSPSYAIAHRNLGLAVAGEGRIADALPHFARAVQYQPTYLDAHLTWGGALTSLQRYPEAFTHFDTALRLAPHSPAPHLAYGRALLAAGRLPDALSHFQQAAELAPDSAEAHGQLSVVLRQLGRPDEAARHAAEAQRLSSGR